MFLEPILLPHGHNGKTILVFVSKLNYSHVNIEVWRCRSQKVLSFIAGLFPRGVHMFFVPGWLRLSSGWG